MTLPFTGFVVPSGGSSSGGSGDVTGPGSSTDNAIARFDGAGGKTLQDSGILVTDAAQLSWEGATADDFEITLGVTDPTADRTILLPNESGTLVVGSTGATDDAILIADGTGGATLAASAATLTAGGSLTIPAGETLTVADDAAADADSSIVSSGSMSIHAAARIYFATANTLAVSIINSGQPGGVQTRSDGGFSISSSSSISGNPEIKLLRSSTGVFGARNGANSSPVPILQAVLVEANTAGSGAPNVIAATESNTTYTNEGATAQNYHTLPTAVAGYVYEFIVQDADGIRIVANTDDTIRVIDKVTAAAGYIESTTIGSTVRLVSINAVEWFATSIHGVWTDGTFTFDDTGSTSP